MGHLSELDCICQAHLDVDGDEGTAEEVLVESLGASAIVFWQDVHRPLCECVCVCNMAKSFLWSPQLQ